MENTYHIFVDNILYLSQIIPYIYIFINNYLLRRSNFYYKFRPTDHVQGNNDTKKHIFILNVFLCVSVSPEYDLCTSKHVREVTTTYHIAIYEYMSN
jgi:hypothetical protein